MIEITPTAIPDVLLITTRAFGDDRGWFTESWSRQRWAEAGLDIAFVQDNHSLSRPAGTLRGLHFQTPPRAQDKLVRCLRGRILDVAVDIRSGSPTFGQHVAVELSAENRVQIFVPKGFAHGFITLEPDCEVFYKVSDIYSPENDGGIAWDDPALGIDWGRPADQIVTSPKDRLHPRLADCATLF
ncbi:dTDP-4-dehydrorhamnose 3,5-epimerase [Novispirillum sp. DQ9]|uniref:dTDP-4-dehydrorhamnose 3,5-epimerase n=1 Tax=Novispirillum sp. DQ9 TaxID=3398612 RepID=UPI003C7BF0A8